MFNSSHNAQIHNSSLYQNITNYQIGVPRGFDILTKAVASNAFHNSDDRPDPPKCHENTRVAVINKIMDWVTGKIDTDAFLLWLYGSAGAGKSAIARSVAERCEELGVLLASFFFFRTDSRRNSLEPLIASIAYCVALVVPSSRGLIEHVVETNPLIFQYSLEVQFTKLVLEPLRSLSDQGHFETTPLPPLIIIDGLDECLDEDSQIKLLRVFSSSMQKWRLPLKLLIASRPEPHIKFGFQSLKPQGLLSHLELNDDFSPDEDIRLFLVDKFNDIRRNHPFSARILISPWPSEAQLDSLVRKASGQFIYASMAVRFVDSPRHIPVHRLEIILDLRPANRDLPFAELDKLYQYILSRVSDPPLVSQILGVRLAMEKDLYLDLALGAIEFFLSLEEGEASTALADLHSLIQFQDDKIAFHHSSFTDFLCNQQRSKDYFADVPRGHRIILRSVLQAFRRCVGDTKSCSPNNALSGQGQALMDIPKEVYQISFSTHLSDSLSTVDFRDDIKEFDLNAYMQQGSCHYPVCDLANRVKWFLERLKISDLCDLHEHHSTVLDQFINSDLKTCPKILLLSMVWFVLQKPLKKMAKPGPFREKLVWRDLWSEVLELNPTDQDWQKRYDLLLFPTFFEYYRADFNGIESLQILYGDINATAGYVPPCLSGDTPARLAAICIEYLSRCGSGKKRATRKVLHAWAIKSAQSPWLSKTRARQIRPWGPRHLPQSIQGVVLLLFSTPEQAKTLSVTAYISYLWMLDFLRRLLLVAGRESSNLLNLRSKIILPYPARMVFPRRTRRLSQASERYINRFSPKHSECDYPEGSDGCMVEESLFDKIGYASHGSPGDDGYATCPEDE